MTPSFEPPSVGTMLYRAKAFAAERHHGQQYGECLPYTVHLEQVVKVLCEFGYAGDIELLQAGYLHDTLEDTNTLSKELAEAFGPRVHELVWRVTGRGRNRKERNACIAERARGCPDAITLKLADRIANVRHSKLVRGPVNVSKLKMYAKEHQCFFNSLTEYRPHTAQQWPMWCYLYTELGFGK